MPAAASAVPSAVPMPRLSPEELRDIYRAMVRLRLLDERMMTLQRQGRIGFYGACPGQEAACIASAYALEKDDWIFPALREGGAMLLRGYPLVPYLAQLFGNSLDELKGRQMPSHPASRRVNQASWGSCIGTQLPQAVGAAFGARALGRSDVVLAYLGDGATSTSDFHSALTFAGVWKAPVVFFCQNNHWSISVPTHRQTAAETLAVKATGYGLPGVRVDGNDAEAVHAVTREAVERARRGEGPTFIEAVTYRMGAHSSSDDPSRYRDEAEVALWRTRDPVERLRKVVFERAGWSDEEETALLAEVSSEIAQTLAVVEAAPDPARETLFDDVYQTLPWHLREQREELVTGPSE